MQNTKTNDPNKVAKEKVKIVKISSTLTPTFE